MHFVVVIPVRFFSTRFPGKALADIHGKPMIVRVMEKALDSGANKVIVATDSVRIAKVIESEQSACEVCLTRSNHKSGTERLAEVAINYKFSDDQIIVHLQGDEPFISSVMIRKVANILYSIGSNTSMVTLATPLTSLKEACNYNVVKVVVNINNNALYFSRSMIPWNREYSIKNRSDSLLPSKMVLRHIGIYSYQAKFLYRYVEWTESPLEQLEKLEQLRVLWYGEKIHVSIVNNACNISIDTPEALKYVNILFEKKINP